ncbi:MAG: class I SAM-dependent methyltransferase [Thermodesulfobacteriota bacterium]
MNSFAQVPIQEVRKYWNSRPCNLRHSRRPIGTVEYFDEVEARKYLVEPHIPAFAQFERWRGKTVLEIGCGLGTDTINFARAGAKVTAVDLSEESLALARRRAELYGLDITFYQADAEKLTNVVPVETYDLVYSFGVLHHTPHPCRAVEQLKQYLGPASRLKIMLYHRYSWKVFWILMKYGHGAFWDLDHLVARYSEAQTGCPVTYTFSKKTAAAMLEGFEIESFTVDHIFPYRLPEYKQHRYRKVWYFDVLPEKVFRELEKRFGWHLCVEARLAGERPSSSPDYRDV